MDPSGVGFLPQIGIATDVGGGDEVGMPGFQGLHLGAEHGARQRQLQDGVGTGGAAAKLRIGDGGSLEAQAR